MGYSVEQIAELANIGVKSVYKKLKSSGIEAVDCACVVGGGRPVKIYSDDALNLFPTIKTLVKKDMRVISKAEFAKTISVKIQKNKSIVSKSRLLSEELNKKLLLICKRRYLLQGDERGLLRATSEAVEMLWNEISAELPADATIEKFTKSYYGGYLNRGKNEGVAKVENWSALWKDRHHVNQTNAKTVTTHYETMKLLVSGGWIGKGFGAGKIWVIDGTQFDALVEHESGKKATFNYLQVMDGITKFPLFIKRLENGETIKDVAEALQECAELHGVPEMGILADNGRAFRSREIQALVRSWYTDAQITKIENDPFRKELFQGQKGIIVYPLAGIPRYIMKASIERSFDALNAHQRECLPISYYGTRDSRFLTHSVGTNQKYMLSEAPKIKDAFNNFLNWIYSEYINRQQFGSMHLSYMKEVGLPATPLNAWLYFGGQFKFNGQEINLDPQEKVMPVEKCAPYYALATCENVHAVKPQLGFITVTESKETLQFLNKDLFDYRRVGGEKVSVCLSQNKREAYIFQMHEIKRSKPKNEDSARVIIDAAQTIEFLGIAKSAVVNDISHLSEVRAEVRDARRAIYADKRAELKEILGDDYKYKNLLSDERAEYSSEIPENETKEIEEIEEIENYKVLDYPNVYAESAEIPPIPAEPEKGGESETTPTETPPESGEWLKAIPKDYQGNKNLDKNISSILEDLERFTKWQT